MHRFMEEAVANFMSEFTHDSRIANQHGMPAKAVAAGLKKARLQPALSPSEFGLYFYRTADVPEFEAA